MYDSDHHTEIRFIPNIFFIAKHSSCQWTHRRPNDNNRNYKQPEFLGVCAKTFSKFKK